MTFDVIREFQYLPRSSDPEKPNVQDEIASRVCLRLQPIQATLPGVTGPIDRALVVKAATAEYVKHNIDIPRIVLVPAGEATAHERQHGGKPWRYLLIPHDAIDANRTVARRGDRSRAVRAPASAVRMLRSRSPDHLPS